MFNVNTSIEQWFGRFFGIAAICYWLHYTTSVGFMRYIPSLGTYGYIFTEARIMYITWQTSEYSVVCHSWGMKSWPVVQASFDHLASLVLLVPLDHFSPSAPLAPLIPSYWYLFKTHLITSPLLQFLIALILLHHCSISLLWKPCFSSLFTLHSPHHLYKSHLIPILLLSSPDPTSSFVQISSLNYSFSVLLVPLYHVIRPQLNVYEDPPSSLIFLSSSCLYLSPAVLLLHSSGPCPAPSLIILISMCPLALFLSSLLPAPSFPLLSSVLLVTPRHFVISLYKKSL